MTLHVLAWVLAGTKETGTAHRDSPGLELDTPTYGLLARHEWQVQASRLRFIDLVPYLFELGAQVRTLPWPAGTSFEERLPAVLEAIKWADVVQWQASNWNWVCHDCSWPRHEGSLGETRSQHLARGHRLLPSNLDLLELYSIARVTKRLAWVLDADDYFEPDPPAWLKAQRPIVTAQHPIELRGNPVREADLLTVSTPRLARVAKQYNENVRVIRNSINPSAYVTGLPRPFGPTRLVWYGDYRRPDFLGSYCQKGIQDHRSLLTTVHVGARTFEMNYAPWREACDFDEARSVVGWDVFPFALADAHPEIGVAPLAYFTGLQASCKSELHWLEYAACGAPTVAQRFRGGGPYDVIQNGVDGFLAHGRREWTDAIGRLARSPQLRADIGGAARERVLRDYGNPRQRAEELRDAYLWAAEHAGIGRRAA